MSKADQPNLTDALVKSAKAEPGTRKELWDHRLRGLHLRITDRGVKSWFLRYRTTDGRHPRYSIGRYPGVGLADAREMAEDIVRQVAKGGDPATARRQARAMPADTVRTFNDLADKYEAACASGDYQPKGKAKRDTVLREETGILKRNVRPVLGPLPFDKITRAEVKALLKALREPTKARPRKLGAQVNRTQAVIRQVYSFAIAEELANLNPATGFAPLAAEKPRARIWTDEELRALWGALTDPFGLVAEDGKAVSVSENVRIAIKLAALLGQRRGEISGMARSELNLEARTLLLPAERMKGSKPHMVPLSEAAVALIRRAIEVADAGRDEPSAFVFPTTRAGEDRPIRPDSMSQALMRLCVGLKIKGATTHDIRRTVSSNLTSERCGVSPFIRSKILGHIDAGGGALVSSTHYDSNTYLSEKRQGLEVWTALLLEIVGEKERPSNVTPIREAVA